MKSIIIKVNNKVKARNLNMEPEIPDGINIIEEIFPEEGMYLTQIEDVDIAHRIITDSSIILSKNTKSSEWKEITAEEAQIFLDEQERFRLQQLEIPNQFVSND